MPVRTLRLIHSPTANWEAVRAFYRDVLQLPETGGWDAPGDRGSFLDAGAGEIEVMEVDTAATGVMPPATGPWRLALEVEDLDAEYRRLQALEVPVAQEVQARPWGSRDFVVRDPAGNPVLIFEHPAEQVG